MESVLAGLSTSKKKQNKALDSAIGHEDDDAMQSIFNNVDGHLGKIQGFRWHAEKTQKQQDLHLHEYRKWMSAYLRRKNESIPRNDGSSACNDLIIFTSDEAVMTQYINTYLVIAANQLKNTDGDEASIVALISRRASILFWLERLNSTSLDHNRLHRNTKDTLLYALKSLGFEQASLGSNVLYFGKNEMIDLIDFDTASSKTPEVAEQHHLAWVISWVCGVRPSSLGDDEFKWKDVTIAKTYDAHGVFNGGFAATICISFFKHRRDSMVKKTLRFTMLTPRDPKLIPFSPTYRILAILLRRKLLHDCETVHELMHGTRHHVTIKAEAHNQAVFLKAKMGGSGERGYADGSTLYSWRKNFANEVAEELGVDAAREFMGHAADSNILEKHYQDPNATVDFFGLVSGVGQDLDQVRESRSEALNVAGHALDVQARRKVVNEWLELQPTIIALRERGATSAASSELKSELQRLRKLAGAALLEHSRNESMQQRTSEDYLSALQRMKSGSSLIYDSIKERVAQSACDDDENYRDVDEEDVNGDREVDEGDGDAEAPNLITYVESFFTFMKVEGKTLGAGEPRKCQLCIEDDTVTGTSKTKLWANQSLHDRHVNGTFHNGFNTWCRRVALDLTSDGRFQCPYGCGRTYEQKRALISHVETGKLTSVKDRRIAAEHERLKVADGWYSATWRFDGAADALRQKTHEYDASRRSNSTFDENTNEGTIPTGISGTYASSSLVGKPTSLNGDMDGGIDNDSVGDAPDESVTTKGMTPLRSGSFMEEVSCNGRKRALVTDSRESGRKVSKKASTTQKVSKNASITDWFKAAGRGTR
ncbi:hypothetical protein IFR05_000100 [Cadophora sp. M221]|nr:hypothetical protein IFR05_000100 [Cadophora sp. M221]